MVKSILGPSDSIFGHDGVQVPDLTLPKKWVFEVDHLLKPLEDGLT